MIDRSSAPSEEEVCSSLVLKHQNLNVLDFENPGFS